MSNESDLSLVIQFHKTLAFTKSQETINKTNMSNTNEAQCVNYTLLKNLLILFYHIRRFKYLK